MALGIGDRVHHSPDGIAGEAESGKEENDLSQWCPHHFAQRPAEIGGSPARPEGGFGRQKPNGAVKQSFRDVPNPCQVRDPGRDFVGGVLKLLSGTCCGETHEPKLDDNIERCGDGRRTLRAGANALRAFTYVPSPTSN